MWPYMISDWHHVVVVSLERLWKSTCASPRLMSDTLPYSLASVTQMAFADLRGTTLARDGRLLRQSRRGGARAHCFRSTGNLATQGIVDYRGDSGPGLWGRLPVHEEAEVGYL